MFLPDDRFVRCCRATEPRRRRRINLQASFAEPQVANAPLTRAARHSDETYRYYRIVAGQRGLTFMAVAYPGKSRAFTARGETLEDAVEQTKTAIDADFEARLKLRGDSEPSHEDLVLALDLIGGRRSPVQQHLLHRIWQSGTNPTSIAILRGRSDFSTDALVRALTRLAKQIADALDIATPKGPGAVSAGLELLIEHVPAPVDPDAKWLFRRNFASAVARHMSR
jgi:hypothetical protein